MTQSQDAPSDVSATTVPPQVAAVSPKRYVKVLRRKRDRTATPQPQFRKEMQAKSRHGLASDIARQIRFDGFHDPDEAGKVLHEVRAILSPRKRRTANNGTIRAAEMLMEGESWPRIYAAVLGDRWEYRPKEENHLRRNAKNYVKKVMRKVGTTDGQTVSAWIRQRLKSQSKTSPVFAPAGETHAQDTSTPGRLILYPTLLRHPLENVPLAGLKILLCRARPKRLMKSDG